MKCFFIFLLSLFFYTCADDSWTVAIYMEASYGLHDAALKNINDLAFQGPNENVNFLVQLHFQGKDAWRYLIKKKQIIQAQKIELTDKTDQNILDFFKWCVNYKPAQQYALILWNHGFGILNPTKNLVSQQWEFEKQTLECKRHHKAMLVDNYHNSIMEAKQLAECIKEISVFLDKKLDILGMDLCMGAMFEIIFEFADYVNVYIGSQNCEFKDGWDYEAISKNLDTNSSMTDFAKVIVNAYKNYYEANALTGFYTQSAINLGQINQIKENLDRLSQEIMNLCKEDFDFVRSLILDARTESLCFCLHSDYVDLINFLERIQFKFQSSFKNSYLTIINLIEETIYDIKKAIILNRHGKKVSHANGISIYVPKEFLDNTYLHCSFAQNSLWLNFLKYSLLKLENF